MNDMIIDAEAETAGAIAKLATTNLAAIITTPGAMDALLDRIERDARTIRAGLDISTEKGRKAIGSLAKSKVANAKVQIVEAANKLTEGWRTQTAAVVADRKKVEIRLDALRDEIEADLVAWRVAKAATEKANEDAMAALEALVVGLSDLTSAQIDERMKQAGVVNEFAWSMEFVALATRSHAGVVAQLQVAYQAALAREAEAAAEVIRLAEEAEHQRLAAAEAQKAREAEIAAEATRRAESEAARKAAEAAQAAQARLQAEAEKAQRAEEVAARLRAQAETARIEAHRAAIITMQRLAEPLAHPDPVVVIDAKLGQLADIFARDWEEVEVEAADTHTAALETLRRHRAESVALAERADLDRKEAQRVRDEVAQTMAEARLAQEQEASAEKLKAALEAERQRIADEKAETARVAAVREQNVAHRRKVNGEVVADIMKAMEPRRLLVSGSADEPMKEIAAEIMKAIVRGEVRHCRVEY